MGVVTGCRDWAPRSYVTSHVTSYETTVIARRVTARLRLNRERIRWSRSFEATMDFCKVCSVPLEADNTMRRDCCAFGFVHLDCIATPDLESCHACGMDPMKGWTEGLARCCLRPLNWESPPQASPQGIWSVELANRHLAKWREMVGSMVDEATSGWKERIRVSDMEVGASFLDGNWLVDTKYMPPHMLLGRRAVRQHMTKLICESLDRWAGAYDGHFNILNICLYKLDDIVELTVRFTCTQWAYHVVSKGDRSRPFETKRVRRELGIWNCFVCLSGFKNVDTDSEPQAKRIVLKEVKRNSR